MSTAPGGATRGKADPNKLYSALSVLFLVFICCLANYRCINCFFFADDLLCLDYLYKIFHGQPGLLLTRMISPWQEPSISLLYRPFCDLIFFANYAFWHNHACGYHLTNLAFHCAVTVLLFFCVRRLCYELRQSKASLIAFLSAAVFAAYPAHVEPVVWLVGCSDLSAAFFLLAAFYVLIKNVEPGRKTQIIAAIFYLAALLSKEASACAPAIIFAGLLFVQEGKLRPTKAFKQIIPLVLVTLIYLLARLLILGTLLGGYSGSLGEALRFQRMAQIFNWNIFALLGLPGNLALFDVGNPLMLSLRAAYLILAVLLLLRLPVSPWDKKTSKIILFFAFATAASLIPALPVLGISGAMINARVFYLSGVFFIPMLVAAVVPHEEKLSPFMKVVACVTIFALTIIIVAFMFVSIKSYSPWLEGSKALTRLQSDIYERLVATDSSKKLVILNQYANYKGAHLLYRCGELKQLVGCTFYRDNLSDRLMALDEYPDFFSASTTRLKRLLQDSRHYDVQFFDFDSLKLNTVIPSRAGTSADFEKSACRFSPTGSPHPLDRAYWVILPYPVQIDDSSQIELTLNWTEEKTRGLCGLMFSNTDRAPQESQLYEPFARVTGGLSTYHISTFELRKIVCQAPAARLYVQMPLEAELVSAYLIPGKSTALLEPDLQTLKELPDGNYLPEKDRAALRLDVSSVPAAAGMILEEAQPDYLFRMSKTCARDPQTYAHIDKSIRFNTTQEHFYLPAGHIKDGCRHAFRLIALDKQGRYTGYYSDTVCIDLRR